MYSFIPLPVLTECSALDAWRTRRASHLWLLLAVQRRQWWLKAGTGQWWETRLAAFPGQDIACLSGEAGLFCSNEEFSSQGLRATCRLAGSCHLERGGHCAHPTSSTCSLEQPQDTAAHSSLSCGHSPACPPNAGGLEGESRPPHTGIIPCISVRASSSEFARVHRWPGNIHCIPP